MEYKFNWNKFTEDDYVSIIEKWYVGTIGAVRVGDIKIELSYYKKLYYNFIVAHEDTGYDYTNEGIPLDYIRGGILDINNNLSYEKFKEYAEKEFSEFIDNNINGDYNLKKHAVRLLEIW